MTGRMSAVFSLNVPGKQCDRIRLPVRTGIVVVMAGLVLCSPAEAAEGVRCGLALCAHSVIPSLFPFLVLSPMLSDAIRAATVQFFRGRLDGRGAALWSAYTVGMLTGFPIGALTVLSLYRQGAVGREDAARFLGVCTGASPAFLSGYFGQALWGSAVLGWIAWLIQGLLCLIGFVLLLRYGMSVPTAAVIAEQEAPPTLAQCISAAVSRMLQICGCVVIFSVLRTFFCQWFGGGMAVLLGGMAEMTGGLRDAAALYTEDLTGVQTSVIISAAVIGFGGVCVGMQISDAAAEAGISMRHYWIQRFLLGAAGALAAAVIGYIRIGIG